MSSIIEESLVITSTSSSFKKALSFENSIITVQAWKNELVESLETEGTHFGYVFQGQTMLTSSYGEFLLNKGMYFSVPDSIKISGSSTGLLITHFNYKGFFQLGGPVEKKGRLRYIDGCTDSLLIAPPVYGDPCLNLLNIPKDTFQTQHTHPSLRAGIIISGSGQCITPENTYDLEPGLNFVIPAEVNHSFRTDSDELLVLAYHPDSDFGPSHQNHPMINRTVIKNL